MTTRLPSALALAALLSAGACDALVDPEEVPGTYALASVAGTPLPALVLDGEHGRVEAVADTLRLNGDGTGTRVAVQRYRPFGAAQWQAATRDERGLDFTLRGGRVEITMRCGPAELCAAGPHYTGSVSGDELRLTGGGIHPGGGAFLYRRVAR